MRLVAGEGRGRPVVFFACLLLCWIALRVATFEAPWPRAASFAEIARAEQPAARAHADGSPDGPARPATGAAEAPIVAEPGFPLPASDRVLPAREMPVLLPPANAFSQELHASGHNLAWMAAMGALPVPASIAALLDVDRPASESVGEAQAKPSAAVRRWRVDGWLFLRPGGSRIAPGGARPASYGASQAGAVLAFRLAPHSARRPSAYARVSHALVAQGESEAALGLSLRPLPRFPVTAHAELRATRRQGSVDLRPAAFLAGDFAHDDLPFGLAARGYAQAGYVAGDFATGFVDGQLALDREVRRFDIGKLRVGAGAWGGAQKDASRLDLGPAASFDFELADAPVRLSLDYRLRVAGDAEPDSGAALTLSTGF